jgi:hypothetical protein
MMPCYTKEQLHQLLFELRAIALNGVSVFAVTIINAATDTPLEVSQIRGSGMIYLRVQSGVSVGNFAAWVEVPEFEEVR